MRTNSVSDTTTISVNLNSSCHCALRNACHSHSTGWLFSGAVYSNSGFPISENLSMQKSRQGNIKFLSG